ncbi:unnamed protein product [Darwinula stevensoni]|uniref:AMP-dependent synthetase/ligase domain-containing protein n=1 Tax=Darwinula stevensoni TaxID=69355 RepID=A0A7R8XM96_9CRUS|nr:unnamed protein product [Darwinula stevensoni]CAG0895335.1 unnamed protein product [Darwinula stevensoni]
MANLSILRGERKEAPDIGLVHEIFEARAKGTGKKEALRFRWRSMDFTELNETCNKLARLLRARMSGSEGDPVVAVCMEPSLVLVVSLISILKTGSAYLPLDPEFPAERIDHILRDANPMFVLKSGESKGLEEGRGSHLLYDVEVLLRESRDLSPEDLGKSSHLVYDIEILLQESQDLSPEDLGEDSLIPIKRAEDRLAAILYTSGSTGTPKGVRLPHRVLLNRLLWQWDTFPYGDDEVCCFKTAVTFVDSISEIFGSLCDGKTLLIVPRGVTRYPEEFLAEVRQYEVRRLVLVPTLLRSILLYARSTKASDSVGSLRLWVCSGETLTQKAVIDFFDLFPDGHTLCNFYGSTEVMGDVTYEVFRSRQEALVKTHTGKVSIGRPIYNTILYVLDGDMRPVVKGEIGEIFLAGNNLASLYVRVGSAGKFLANPDLTEGKGELPKMQTGLWTGTHHREIPIMTDYGMLYRTGDYGRIVDGRVIFEGRTDSQVKVRGHRVDLSEIEAALAKLGLAVSKATVLCYHPGDLDQDIIAFYVGTVATEEVQDRLKSLLDIVAFYVGTVATEEVQDRLKSLLVDYMMPQVVRVPGISLLPNGKIDRQALLRTFQAYRSRSVVPLGDDFLEKLPEEKRDAAASLIRVLFDVLGFSLKKEQLNLQSNFFDIGGNSLNALLVVIRLTDLGFPIAAGIGEFLKAPHLGKVLDRMCLRGDGEARESSTGSPSFLIQPLTGEDREEFIKVLSRAFATKEQWIGCTEKDFNVLLNSMWPSALENDLSFSVRRHDGRLIAVAFNMDFSEEPDMDPPEALLPVLTMLHSVENPQKFVLASFADSRVSLSIVVMGWNESFRSLHVPRGKNEVLYSFMMATDESVSKQENVLVMQIMEEEIIRLAKRKGYSAILATNTNALAQQLASVLGYELLQDFQVNQFVMPDGSTPFSRVPDEQRAICVLKHI